MAKARGEERREHNGDQRRQDRRLMKYDEGRMLERGMAWPLARLRSEFDRLFEDVFRGWGPLPAWSREMQPKWDLDVEDREDKIIVRAEAPGFDADDFDLQVQDDQLVLCACQNEEKEADGGRQWHQQELYRSIPLPSGIDSEHVDAQYHNGILTVTLPKTEKSTSRRIEVKAQS